MPKPLAAVVHSEGEGWSEVAASKLCFAKNTQTYSSTTAMDTPKLSQGSEGGLSLICDVGDDLILQVLILGGNECRRRWK